MSELFLIVAELIALLTFGAAHVPAQNNELVCYTLDGHRAPEADCRAALEAEVDKQQKLDPR